MMMRVPAEEYVSENLGYFQKRLPLPRHKLLRAAFPNEHKKTRTAKRTMDSFTTSSASRRLRTVPENNRRCCHAPPHVHRDNRAQRQQGNNNNKTLRGRPTLTTMMMKKIIWTAASWVTVATAFTPAFVSKRSMTFEVASPTRFLAEKDEKWDRLSDEYSHLQDELLHDLAQLEQKKEQAQHVAAVMFDKDQKSKSKYNKLQDELLSDLAQSEQKMEQAEHVAEAMMQAVPQDDEYMQLQDEFLHDILESEEKQEQAQHVAEVMFKEAAKSEDVYSHLQDELFTNLAERERAKEHAEEVSELLFETAADLAALERNEQINELDKAVRELQMAHEERNVLEDMNRQAHADYVAAKHQASKLLSFAETVHQVEDDIKNRIVDAKFHELEAEVRIEEATNVLKNLEQNEEELMAALEELDSLKQKKAMEQLNLE
jgi:hypothetical protein